MSSLREALRSVNWKHGLGEVLLIVVGVSIALAGNSWYENRRQRDEEIVALAELHAALALDISLLAAERDTIRDVNDRLLDLVEYVESPDGKAQSEFSARIGALGRFVTLQIRYGPYEAMKARDIDLISNRSLAIKITTLYEDEIPNLVEDSLIDRALARDGILPAQLEHFWLDASREWVPKEPITENLQRTVAALAHYRSGTLIDFYLPSFEQTMSLMSEVMIEIEAELQRLR